MKTLKIVALLFATIALAQTAAADKLCLQSTVNKRTLKVTNKSVVAAKCPKGYTQLADTSKFQGPAGPAGARGVSAFDTIPSGTTVVGYMGHFDIRNVDQALYIYSSIPAKLNTSLVSSKLIIKANDVLLTACGSIACLDVEEQVDNALCTGTFSNPTAPSGYVCIYPTDMSGNIQAQTLEASHIFPATFPATSTGQGFMVSYVSSATGSSWFEATWAYTAP